MGALIAGVGLPGSAERALAAPEWHAVDMTGSVPKLEFAMTDANTGRAVTAADFRGKITLLYLGYTFCPDVCPLTMGHLADIVQGLGRDADAVRVLFVTVDPGRDTVAVLHDYAAAFGPEFVGLRGTPDAIARLASRYRLAYSVDPATATTPYEVTHSAAVYVFDRTGAARLLVPSLATTTPDLAGTTADLRRLIEGAPAGWFSRLLSGL